MSSSLISSVDQLLRVPLCVGATRQKQRPGKVDINQLNGDVNRRFRGEQHVNLSNLVQTICERISNNISPQAISRGGVVPGFRWKVGPREVLAKSVLTVLRRCFCREAVGAKAKWNGVDKDPEKLLQTMDNSGMKWERHEQVRGCGRAAPR